MKAMLTMRLLIDLLQTVGYTHYNNKIDILRAFFY